jgi:Tfp pilus assembly protein PilF
LQLAIEGLEKIIERDENYLPVYYQLARLLEQTRQIEKARLVYANGIRIAQKQGKFKTLSELKSASENL